MRLSRSDKLLLLDVAHLPSKTTANWRPYVALSNKGLADVDKTEAEAWSSLWGVTCAVVALTPKGRALVPELDREVDLWHPIAVAHAKRGPSRCLCGPCMAAWRMRPEAA